MSEALFQSQVQKAERIGRLAAEERLEHDAAHRVADETERLAAIEVADVARRARPAWVGVLLGTGAALAVGLFVTRVTTATFELSLASILGLLGLAAVVVDLVWGNGLLRLGVALRVPWLYRTPAPVREAVLQSYSQQRALLGQEGCDCAR